MQAATTGLSSVLLTDLPTQLTHGFPLSPNPLFVSDKFPIENRPGLHDQSVNVLCTQLGSVVPAGSLPGDLDTTTKDKVARMLSDWHLLYFLANSGMLEDVSVSGRSLGGLEADRSRLLQNEIKLLARVAAAHETGDRAALDVLLESTGWQTIWLLAEEQRAQG